MIDTLSQDEIARRITALLNTRRTGQAVADYLERQNPDPSNGAVMHAPRAVRVRRAEAAWSDG